jgi:hypothetical protein
MQEYDNCIEAEIFRILSYYFPFVNLLIINILVKVDFYHLFFELI